MGHKIRGWCWTVLVSVGCCLADPARTNAQVFEVLPDAPTPQYAEQDLKDGTGTTPVSESTGPRIYSQDSVMDRVRDIPRRILLGSAVPRDKELYRLNQDERFQLYLKRTYFSAGSYFERAFGAGYDQARGVPSAWGGGMEGYGKRFASRYAQFVIRSTLTSAGDAALGYEPRYELCRCDGFWNRTKHAIMRNFLTYNSTENELRPQLPYYGASFLAGMVASTWKPGRRNVWEDGGIAAAEQMGWGVLRNWLSEFSGDIGRKISKRH